MGLTLRRLPECDQRVGDGLDFGGADAFEVLGEEFDVLLAGPAGLSDDRTHGGGLGGDGFGPGEFLGGLRAED